MTLQELEALDRMPAPAAPPNAPPMPPGQPNAADLAALETTPAAPAQQPAPAGRMSLEQLEALDAAPAPQVAQPDPAPGSQAPLPTALPAANGNPLDPSAQIGGAILTGAAKSIYETKDFLFGKPAEADKSDMRRGIEALDKSLGEASMGNSFVSGLSQFATGMLGAGKLIGMAKAVPGVAGASAAAGRVGGAVLEGAGAGASASLGAGSAIGAQVGRAAAVAAPSSLTAATVGAVAFDPNGPRLSDLMVLHGASWLQNPVSSYLARTGNEDDTAAEGRLKNALESIGTDAALIGVFAGSVKVFGWVQAYRAGKATAEQVEAAGAELAQAVAHEDAKLAASKGDPEAVEALRLEYPEAVAQAETALAPPTVTPRIPVRPADVGEQVAGAVGQSDTPTTIKPDGTGETTLSEIEAGPAQAMTRATDAGEVVSSPGGALDVTAQPTPRPDLFGITDDQVQRLVAHGRADTEQLMGPGGWDGALERGYTFGDGGRIPWQKFALEPGTTPGTAPLDQVIRRVADEFAGEIAAAKGGDGSTGVRSDAMQERLIQQRTAIYGDDPEALLGSLQMAGRGADRLVADVAAADLITLRAATDAQNLADRIRLGMLEEFDGSLSSAMAALRGHYQVAATARASSAAMVANAARTLRRQRADFAYTPEDVAAMGKLSDAQMLNLIEAAGRDPWWPIDCSGAASGPA